MIRDATLDTSYLGVQFLPVDKKIYLKLQSILRRLELRFSSLKETFFLYKDQLIWYNICSIFLFFVFSSLHCFLLSSFRSGLSQDDTSLIYSFFRLYYWPNIKILLNSSITTKYLTIDTTANPADELIISSYTTSKNYQKFFLGNPIKSHRVLAINMNLITIFCFFHDGKMNIIFSEFISIFFKIR